MIENLCSGRHRSPFFPECAQTQNIGLFVRVEKCALYIAGPMRGETLRDDRMKCSAPSRMSLNESEQNRHYGETSSILAKESASLIWGVGRPAIWVSPGLRIWVSIGPTRSTRFTDLIPKTGLRTFSNIWL